MRTTLFQSEESSMQNQKAVNAFIPIHSRLVIERGSVRSIELIPNTSVSIRAFAGAFWITMEGETEDYILEGGDTAEFYGPGLLVLEGLLPTNTFEQSKVAPKRDEISARCVTQLVH